MRISLVRACVGFAATSLFALGSGPEASAQALDEAVNWDLSEVREAEEDEDDCLCDSWLWFWDDCCDHPVEVVAQDGGECSTAVCKTDDLFNTTMQQATLPSVTVPAEPVSPALLQTH